eukprot:scaffold3346_cov313-Pinguiococcus_pyrenoidosus.AAC.8
MDAEVKPSTLRKPSVIALNWPLEVGTLEYAIGDRLTVLRPRRKRKRASSESASGVEIVGATRSGEAAQSPQTARALREIADDSAHRGQVEYSLRGRLAEKSACLRFGVGSLCAPGRDAGREKRPQRCGGHGVSTDVGVPSSGQVAGPAWRCGAGDRHGLWPVHSALGEDRWQSGRHRGRSGELRQERRAPSAGRDILAGRRGAERGRPADASGRRARERLRTVVHAVGADAVGAATAMRTGIAVPTVHRRERQSRAGRSALPAAEGEAEARHSFILAYTVSLTRLAHTQALSWTDSPDLLVVKSESLADFLAKPVPVRTVVRRGKETHENV